MKWNSEVLRTRKKEVSEYKSHWEQRGSSWGKVCRGRPQGVRDYAVLTKVVKKSRVLIRPT